MRHPMNFNPGPSTLPLPALERARAELLDFAGTGISVMEHSHRGKEYEALNEEAISLLSRLLGLPSSYGVLFLQGGASTEFARVAMNFLPPGGSADYVVTGAWSDKAYTEGVAWGGVVGAHARVAASTKESGFTRVAVAEESILDAKAAYVHFTSNETIHGVQYRTLPRFGDAPHICDASSDILSRPMDLGPLSLVYAGAQKNMGPAGVTVVVARRDFLQSGRRDLPSILQYRTHAEANSLLNTPPMFGIYLLRNVLSWLEALGGVGEMERRNRAKAAELYAAIDAHAGFFRCPVDVRSRSEMNAVFRLPSEELEKRFIDESKAAGMLGLKGHRSVGGIRVSLYNAVEPAWVTALVSFMNEFVKRNG